MKKLKTDAVILDVDGTLWDTTGLAAKVWTKALRDNGFPDAKSIPAAKMKKLFGLTMDVIADRVLPEMPIETRKALLKECEIVENKALSESDDRMFFAGVSETIKALAAKVPVLIVSNSQSGYIELVIEKAHIEGCIFDHICYGDTGLEKDGNIALMINKYGFKNAVYVGDILNDEIASRKAGARFIYASYGFGEADKPDAVISSFSELKDVIIPVKKKPADVKKELVKAAVNARKMAYAPYSGYTVGAALLTDCGRIFTGCNVENASYGATNCAERTAVFKAVSEGFTRFSAIAIAGGVKGSAGKAYPCGVCRQVLREFCAPSDMKIYVVGSDDDVESFTLEELLPESFGPDFKSVK